MRRHEGTHQTGRSERGAILIIAALCMTALFLIVAIVIDLGITRGERRNGQLAVDNAAASAGQTYKDTADAIDACESALAYLTVTLDTPAFVGDSGETCATRFAGSCVDNSARTLTARSGDYTVTIDNPVIDSSPLMARTSTIGNAGVTADAALDGRGCERFGVQVTTTGESFFGGIAGAESRASTAHAVALIRSTTETEEVAALQLLERVGCGALQTSGGGDEGAGIFVRAASSTVPGIIAADSAGQTPPCTNNNNANGWVIYGTALPEAGGGGPSITAEAASATIPGIISVYAESIGGRSGYTAPSGLNVEPSGGGVNSRDIADKRYNGVNTQISQLHGLVESLTAAAPDSTYASISGDQECKGTIPAAKLEAARVFVDCSTFEPELNIFPDATHFMVRGNVSIKNNKVLSLPAVQHFFVRGCSVGGCTGSNTFAVDVSGTLLLNTGDDTIPSPVTGGTACKDRHSPNHVNEDDETGTTTNTTRLATRGGDVTVSGFVRMCQTTLYAGEDSASYVKQSVIAPGTEPENYPPIALCSPEKPCPKDDAASLAAISFGGGSSSADWSAPNQLAIRPTDTDLQFSKQPFEDLAFWSETSTASSISGQGVNTTTGVYFLPNASFTFTGQGTQSQPLDAQFLARRLNVSGQGSLVMKPDPANSLESTVFGNVALIR